MNISLEDVLSFYNREYNAPYYISSGQPILKYPEKDFRIDFYAFCICFSGSIEIAIDTKSHTINEDMYVVLAPLAHLKFKKASSDLKMKVLFFEKNFLLKNIANPYVIEKMNLFTHKTYSIICNNISKNKNLVNILSFLEEKIEQASIFKNQIVRSTIFTILFEIADTLNKNQGIFTEEEVIKKDVFLKFNELIKQYILENHSVSFYADKLNISSKYLIMITKNASGKTPHEIINETLLKEALVLLNNSYLTISQIADILLFNSSSAFGRFFKKHTSFSPSEYRKKEHLG